MAVKQEKARVLAVFERDADWLSAPELSALIDHSVPERTLRRWLARWVKEGRLLKQGQKRGTRYRQAARPTPSFQFLEGLNDSRKIALLAQIRDLWTHNSTAVEGNTLSLGDTHFLLEEGLTVSGKPIKDHQEAIGHARAIELVYASIFKPVTEAFIFELHKSVQTEQVTDIYKPYGSWKIEPNGTYMTDAGNRQIYIEYALPAEVPFLMKTWIKTANSINSKTLTLSNAHIIYAKLHAGIAHIHPFWDGNGRIARLLANIPLLKAGLPPVIIPVEERKRYIQVLADYELNTGTINRNTGVWPMPEYLDTFEKFVKDCYSSTIELVEKCRSHGEGK